MHSTKYKVRHLEHCPERFDQAMARAAPIADGTATPGLLAATALGREEAPGQRRLQKSCMHRLERIPRLASHGLSKMQIQPQASKVHHLFPTGINLHSSSGPHAAAAAAEHLPISSSLLKWISSKMSILGLLTIRLGPARG